MKNKILIAQSAGFCFGVRRAIDLAEKTVLGKDKIYTLGPLIHNPQEIKRLAKRGIRPVKTAGRLRDETLVLRTHGIPDLQRERLESRKLTIVDATCPFVKRAQDIIRKLCDSDCQIIIVGDKIHPEVVALVSYGKGKCRVIEDKEGLKKVKLGDKVCVLSQTTQTLENFKEVIRVLKKLRPNVKVFNTICKATVYRQTEVKRLAKKVDVLIVVGGKNSGNTGRLAEIGKRYSRTFPIETAVELKKSWFKNVSRVGLTAGASTPDWVIKEVKQKIENIMAENGR